MRRFGETNEFDKDFESLDKKVNMSEEEHKEVLSQIKMDMEKESAGRKKSSPWKAYLAVAASAFILFLLALPFFGDNMKERIGSLDEDESEEGTITDNDSEQMLTTEILQLDSNMEVLNISKDGVLDDEKHPEMVVADVSYYEVNPVKRGDLVMLEIPEGVADDYADGITGTTAGRVIGLPGETINIEKGQIYVNDRKLDTFYGKVYEWPPLGHEQDDLEEDIRGGYDAEEFQVPEDSFFIRGDYWRLSRVGLTVNEEKEIEELVSIPEKFIKGKVIGYYGKEVDEPEEKQEQEDNTNPEEVITDPDTEPWLGKVEAGPDMLVETVQSNGMNRGKFEFWNREIVIDPDYYPENDLKRGDIINVAFPVEKLPDHSVVNDDRTISRVIGLPGETVKIEDGQLYINGKKLDTFYGKALSRGMSQEAYDGDNLDDFFEKDMEEIQLSENQIYVLDDTWWRGLDSGLFGPLSTDSVIGKVIGYTSFDATLPFYTSIEILEWESNELVKEITNNDFLNELHKQILSSRRSSVSNIESNPPDFKIVLNQGDDVIGELGYYREPVGGEIIKGQYLSIESEKLYEITLDLPIQ